MIDNLHLINWSADIMIFEFTPFISMICLFFCVWNDQYLKLPLPLPNRISLGFFVIGWFGNIWKNIWFFFLNTRLRTNLTASIWKFGIKPLSCDIKPNCEYFDIVFFSFCVLFNIWKWFKKFWFTWIQHHIYTKNWIWTNTIKLWI